MLNTAVQTLGKDKTEAVFAALNKLTETERKTLLTVLPTFNSVVEHRDLYAA